MKLSKFEKQKEVVLEYIAPNQNLTDMEVKIYIQKCKKYGVDAMDREIIPVKFGGKITFITTIALMRSLADQTGEYDGQEAPKFEYKENGSLLSCTKTVYRRGRKPFSNTVFFDEYKGNSPFWKNKPHIMLAKCAEVSVLRQAFPSALSGLYTKDEMPEVTQEEPQQADATIVPPKKLPPKRNFSSLSKDIDWEGETYAVGTELTCLPSSLLVFLQEHTKNRDALDAIRIALEKE